MRFTWLSTVCRMTAVTTLGALGLLMSAGLGEAQSTFRFQLEPYCSIVVLTFVPSGSSSVLGVVGYDDNCGDNPRSPIHGTAVLNPDGSITIGYTTSLPYSLYGRSDVGLQTNVEIPATGSSGTWVDDDGYSGTFTLHILDQKSG